MTDRPDHLEFPDGESRQYYVQSRSREAGRRYSHARAVPIIRAVTERLRSSISNYTIETGVVTPLGLGDPDSVQVGPAIIDMEHLGNPFCAEIERRVYNAGGGVIWRTRSPEIIDGGVPGRGIIYALGWFVDATIFVRHAHPWRSSIVGGDKGPVEAWRS